MLITVTFEEHEGKTKLTLKHSGIEGIRETDLGNMRRGWNESFESLPKPWRQPESSANQGHGGPFSVQCVVLE
jgi:hypothetical protein